MRTMWQQTALLACGCLLALACGLWTAHQSWQRQRAPQDVAQARQTLETMGGAAGLASRRQSLQEIRQHLERERDAKASNGAVFSRRLEATFGELDLQLHGSTPWQAVPGLDMPGATAFERRLSGVGSWQGLLDAVHSLESWPDQSRIRSLTLTAPEPGGTTQPPEVAFELEISIIRRRPGHETSDAS